MTTPVMGQVYDIQLTPTGIDYVPCTLRFFRRTCFGDKGRRGVWVMHTLKPKGTFYHADRDETQGTKWPMSSLLSGEADAEEITQAQALEELANWPEAQQNLRHVIEIHRYEHDSAGPCAQAGAQGLTPAESLTGPGGVAPRATVIDAPPGQGTP